MRYTFRGKDGDHMVLMEKRPGGFAYKVESFLNFFGLGDKPVDFDADEKDLILLLKAEFNLKRDYPSSVNAEDCDRNIEQIGAGLRALGVPVPTPE